MPGKARRARSRTRRARSTRTIRRASRYGGGAPRAPLRAAAPPGGGVRPDRPGAAEERRPELVEVAVLRRDRERAVGDLAKPRIAPHRRELPGPAAEPLDLVRGVRVDLAGGVPVSAE